MRRSNRMKSNFYIYRPCGSIFYITRLLPHIKRVCISGFFLNYIYARRKRITANFIATLNPLSPPQSFGITQIGLLDFDIFMMPRSARITFSHFFLSIMRCSGNNTIFFLSRTRNVEYLAERKWAIIWFIFAGACEGSLENYLFVCVRYDDDEMRAVHIEFSMCVCVCVCVTHKSRIKINMNLFFYL